MRATILIDTIKEKSGSDGVMLLNINSMYKFFGISGNGRLETLKDMFYRNGLISLYFDKIGFDMETEHAERFTERFDFPFNSLVLVEVIDTLTTKAYTK